MKGEQSALCKGYHPDLWFPPVFESEQTAPLWMYYDLACMVCEHCPIREHCLMDGIENDESVGMPTGVWGGTNPEDRERGEYHLPLRRIHPSDLPEVIPLNEPGTHPNVAEAHKLARTVMQTR